MLGMALIGLGLLVMDGRLWAALRARLVLTDSA
jgi:hypothetical protein